MSRKKRAGSAGGEGELEASISNMILSTAGTDEPEVTDAEAAAVLAEIFNGKDIHGGAAEDEAISRKATLLKSTTKSLEQAGKLVRVAVAFDSNGQVTEALDSYEKAIELFSQGLTDEALLEKNATHIVQSLESYLNRSIELQLQNITHDFSRKGIFSRKTVLERMANHNYNTLKRGVGLYSKAKKDGKKDDDWCASVLYSEALECLILAMKQPSSAGAKSPMVSQCVNEMMTRLESVHANHPPQES